MSEQALQAPPRDIEAVTFEIISLRDMTANFMAKSAFEIGQRLVEAKELLPHGEWGKWLSERVQFSHRTANRFMQVYTEFSNSSALTNLTFNQLTELLALPPEEREEFVQQNDVENMTTRELQQAIKERDEAREEARRAQEEVEAGRQAVEDAKVLQEASWQAKSDAEERIRVAERRAAESAKEAEEAKAAAKQKQQKAIDAAVKKATEEMKATLAEVNEDNQSKEQALQDLEKELADAKAEAQTAADDAAEEAREAIRAEMAEKDRHIADLERKLNFAGNSAIQKFGVFLEQLHATYNALLAAVEDVEDPDQQVHLRSAVSKVLETFAGRLEGGA